MKVNLIRRATEPVSPVSDPPVPQPSMVPSGENIPQELGQDTQQDQLVSEESGIGRILRNLSRLGARAIESSISQPGELARLIPQELLTPSTGNPLTGAIKLAQQIPERKTLEEGLSAPILESIFGKGAAQPQGKIEKNLDSIVKTAVPLMIGGHQNLLLRGAQALGIASAGQLAKWGAKELNLSKPVQEGVKIGTMIGTSMIGIPTAKKFAGALRTKALETIPESTLVDAMPIRKEFAQIRSKIRRGLKDVPSKEFIEGVINDVESKFTPIGRTIPAHELFAVRQNLNELYPKLNSNSRKYMHDIIETFKKTYESAPKDLLPAFKEYENAQDIFKATNAYPGIVDFVKRTPKLSGASGGAALISSLFINPVKAGLAVGVPALAKGSYDLIGRILSSPSIRNYYMQLTKSLAAERPAASIKWANKLYTSLKKKDPQVIKEIESPSSPSSSLKVRLISGGRIKK